MPSSLTIRLLSQLNQFYLPLLWFLRETGNQCGLFLYIMTWPRFTGRPQKSLITHLDSDSACKNKNIHPQTTFSPSLLCLKRQSCCFCCHLCFLLTPHAYGGQLGLCSSLSVSLEDKCKCHRRKGEGGSTHCPLNLPHGRNTCNFLSHVSSKIKSHDSAWLQGDGYWRWVVLNTMYHFLFF